MRARARVWLASLALVASWPWLSSSAAAPAAPPGAEATDDRAGFERLQGLTTVIVNHVNDAMGTEHLPVASGGGVEPGMLVTITPTFVQIFDRTIAALEQGRPIDPTIAAECASGCPAVLYDGFGRGWLEAAVESTSFAVEIPARVLLAAHGDVPAATLLAVAYAAAETRPVRPPQLALLVNNTRGSLRALELFLLPPRGLVLRQGSAALALTIRVSPGLYQVSSADSRTIAGQQVQGLGPLRALARELKKRHPSKETVILVPDGATTVRELVDVAAAVQESFPRLVLSAGQELAAP